MSAFTFLLILTSVITCHIMKMEWFSVSAKILKSTLDMLKISIRKIKGA